MFRFACLICLCVAMSACGPCPRLQCGPVVEIILGSEDQPVESDETYAIDLDLDGQSIRVTCETPAGPCQVETGSGDYSASASWLASSIDLQIFGVREDAPELIEIYVLAGNDQIFEGALLPEYRDSPRDDRDDSCGVCRSADEAITIPAG